MELAGVALILLGILALSDWRRVILWCVLMGVLQDVLRKLTPGQPQIFVLMVGVVFGLAWLRAAMSGVKLGPHALQAWKTDLHAVGTVFGVLVVLQAVHSFVSWGSPTMTGVGLLVWIAPIPAVMLAYQVVMRQGLPGLRATLKAYVVVCVLALLGVYAEYSGVNLPGLGEVGEGLIIYDVGTALKAYSGFFRSSEIAAWHTATTACFVFMLLQGKRNDPIKLAIALALMAMLATLGLLTGRRKMLVEITVFLTVFAFLVTWFQRGAHRLAATLLAGGVIGYVLIVGFISPDLVDRSYSKRVKLEEANTILGYAVRGQSSLVDLPARVNELGVVPIAESVQAFGWFGAGLGTGSQGTGAAAAQAGLRQGIAEGGLGKITMELGVPGLVVLLWMGLALARYLSRQLTWMSRQSPLHARLVYGCLALLTAKAASFGVASQAYSDMFVLLMLGSVLGFALALPDLARRQRIKVAVDAGIRLSSEPPEQSQARRRSLMQRLRRRLR